MCESQEGIETVDAILSKIYPLSDFEKKDKEREKQSNVEIQKLKMNHLEKLLLPASPISLMINHAKKI